MTRRRVLQLLCLAPIPALVGWRWARKLTPVPVPVLPLGCFGNEEETVIVQVYNAGTADERVSVTRIEPGPPVEITDPKRRADFIDSAEWPRKTYKLPPGVFPSP